MTDNPYRAPTDPLASVLERPPVRKQFGWLITVLCATGLLLALLLPATRSARPAAYRMQCTNNLKQIMLALHNYESKYRAFPPAAIVDPDGQPLHSWRTLILPFLEQQQLYDSIDLSKAWNDPANEEARNADPSAYSCPASNLAPGLTTYMAFSGPSCFLHPTRSRLMSEITDGSSETLAVVEVPSTNAVHWMEPRDLDASPLTLLNASSSFPHTNGFNSAFVDGSVHFLADSVPATTLRSLISIAEDDQEMDNAKPSR